MIQQRNQNRIKEVVNIKPKLQKKQIKVKKQQAQTDAQECQNKKQIKPHKEIAPVRPKKSLPKFQYALNLKDQVQQYEDQIVNYLIQQQPKYKIDENYLKYHKTLNIKIRNFLIKYIFKIVWKYKCKRNTLYLAVYCMDYYFSKSPDFKNPSQCITIAQASLFIAMKFQQIYPPLLKQWATQGEQIKKIMQIQAQILKCIDFKLNLPSMVYFQQYFQKKFCQEEKYQQNKQNLYLQELKINLIGDVCLFDMSLYQHDPYLLAKNIRRLVYGIEVPFNDQRIVLNIKWVLERNHIHLEWLKECKYKELQTSQ